MHRIHIGKRSQRVTRSTKKVQIELSTLENRLLTYRTCCRAFMLGAQERIAARLEKADLFTLLAPRRFVKGSLAAMRCTSFFSYRLVRTTTISLCVSSYHPRVFETLFSEAIQANRVLLSYGRLTGLLERLSSNIRYALIQIH